MAVQLRTAHTKRDEYTTDAVSVSGLGVRQFSVDSQGDYTWISTFGSMITIYRGSCTAFEGTKHHLTHTVSSHCSFCCGSIQLEKQKASHMFGLN